METATTSQIELAELLSKEAKDRCKLLGIKAEKCEPRHFLSILIDFDGKISGYRDMLKACIQWTEGKGYRIFRALRYRNWVKNQIRYAKENHRKQQEQNKLRYGNEYQRAEYARMTGNYPVHPHAS